MRFLFTFTLIQILSSFLDIVHLKRFLVFSVNSPCESVLLLYENKWQIWILETYKCL